MLQGYQTFQVMYSLSRATVESIIRCFLLQVVLLCVLDCTINFFPPLHAAGLFRSTAVGSTQRSPTTNHYTPPVQNTVVQVRQSVTEIPSHENNS
jgi:hypothetical protein